MSIKLTILGTGTFFINKNRSASAYLLEIGSKKILIDCGSGTLMRLSQLGIKLEEIEYVFITHFHADHTSDLFPFFMNFRLNEFFPKKKGIKYPKIFGPTGIKKFMINLSKDFQLPVLNNWDKIQFINIKPSQKIENIKIEAHKVKHVAFGLPANAYAYRFSINNKVISFSGDSVKCPGVEKACKNSDIFVCDTSCPKGMSNPAHMDTHDIAEIASKQNVKKVLLSHFYPEYDKIDLIKEVKEKYSGKVIKGKDLRTVFI